MSNEPAKDPLPAEAERPPAGLGNAWAVTVGATVLLALAVGAAVALRTPREHGESSGYVGPDRCAKCHPEEHESWAETRMARSFDVLRPGQAVKEKVTAGLDPGRDYTRDPKCLACHTTGYGRVGGFVSIEKTPSLAGVTCEACHGGGGQYVDTVMGPERPTFELAEAREKGLRYPPTQEVCRVCHNPQSPFVGEDYRFDFEERVGQGTHRHIKLKYEEVRRRAQRDADGG